MIARPVEAIQITDAEQIPQSRRVDCKRYMSCLNEAVANDWPGFSCQRCQVKEPINRDEHRREMIGMSELWAAVSYHARLDMDRRWRPGNR